LLDHRISKFFCNIAHHAWVFYIL